MFSLFQALSDIYQSSLAVVSNCPNSSDFDERSYDRCAHVCKFHMQESCAYHCMRDSSKTRLVEFCAKPKILFSKFSLTYTPSSPKKQITWASLINFRNKIKIDLIYVHAKCVLYITHCIRVSFIHFIAYCPEYDPVDQTIQKDDDTLCNSISSIIYFYSSDIFVCEYNYFYFPSC